MSASIAHPRRPRAFACSLLANRSDLSAASPPEAPLPRNVSYGAPERRASSRCASHAWRRRASTACRV